MDIFKWFRKRKMRKVSDVIDHVQSNLRGAQMFRRWLVDDIERGDYSQYGNELCVMSKVGSAVAFNITLEIGQTVEQFKDQVKARIRKTDGEIEAMYTVKKIIERENQNLLDPL